MPAYNAAPYIEEAIQSVLGQSYPNWELLIINDGSTDNTQEIILAFEDSRIRYFSQQNQGVAHARNSGLQAMSGDYFCFLDSDDKLPKNSIECRVKIFDLNEKVEFADGEVILFNSDYSKEINKWSPRYYGNPLEDLLQLGGKSFFGPSWMIKRKKEKTYQFKEGLSHGEDLLFYINLAREGGLYGYTEEPVLYYRKGHQSAMSNLKGLEKGYRSIYREIVGMQDIPDELKSMFISGLMNSN
jgi:glycosyltransferase involved in cell wall biosynthesis